MVCSVLTTDVLLEVAVSQYRLSELHLLMRLSLNGHMRDVFPVSTLGRRVFELIQCVQVRWGKRYKVLVLCQDLHLHQLVLTQLPRHGRIAWYSLSLVGGDGCEVLVTLLHILQLHVNELLVVFLHVKPMGIRASRILYYFERARIEGFIEFFRLWVGGL